MSLLSVERASLPGAARIELTKIKHRRVAMGRALAVIIVFAVLSTALIIHLIWQLASNDNIERALSNINAGATAAVSRELAQTFSGAENSAEIIRSALFQGTVAAEDEAKREFLFLSVLRSQPSVSWIGFGFPDGRFFGAHAAEGKLHMVEIGATEPGSVRSFRRDTYSLIPGDIFFEERIHATTPYVVGGTPWYRAAADTQDAIWTTADILPEGFEPAAVVSKRVERFGEFIGVVMVATDYSRISVLLGELDSSDSARIFLIDNNDTVLATSLSPETFHAANLEYLPADDRLSLLARDAVQTGWFERVTLRDPTLGDVYVSRADLPFRDWHLVTAIPRSYFASEIDRAGRYLPYVIAGLALIAAGTAVLFVSFLITRPLAQLSRELQKIEQFRLGEVRHNQSWLTEMDEFSRALAKVAVGLTSFGRYIPVEVVRRLVGSGMEPRPGGEIRPVTVMFADLPNFTQMSEQLGPRIENYLTQFLTIAVEAVEKESGTIDKFIGDEVMAIWNAPGDVADHAERACRAARTIAEQLRSIPLPEGITDGGGPRVRIGINTGNAIVGNVGSQTRLSYTAIGDTVNLASRLVGIAKEHAVEIVVSQSTREAARLVRTFHSLGTVVVRGRKKSENIFELNRSTAPADKSLEPRT
jgi:adenylate cyclase